MGYIALYRQWRPMSFKEIVGQVHIVRTLKNALLANKISHAYLFCGPRGTGKTSMAKIMAKTVNCLNVQDGEPCNECANCQSINSGNSLDILEIDAASNRGIDEIRDLREKIKLSPVEGTYKVYIIDEVHMLTTEAFNALLKTLEEPPSHVIFILATTEPHKIPLTILSRCQRFDFHRISVKEIVERLKEILVANNIDVEEAALYLIAKIAAGGMRDALSLLDQCIVSGNNYVNTDLVTSIVGIVSDNFMLDLVNYFYEKDVNQCLRMLYKALAQGKDVRQFLADLILHLRNLLLLKLGDKAEDLLTVPEDFLVKIKEQSKLFSKAELLNMIKVLAHAENDLKWSSQGQIIMEVALLQLLEENYNQLSNDIDREIKQSVTVKDESTSITKNKIVNNDVKSNKLSSGEGNLDDTREFSLDIIKQKWETTLEAIRKESVMTYAFFVEAEPIDYKDNVLTLQYKLNRKFHKERSEKPENKKIIEGILKNHFGIKISTNYVLVENDTNNKNNKEDDEIVKKALDFFGGEIVEIE